MKNDALYLEGRRRYPTVRDGESAASRWFGSIYRRKTRFRRGILGPPRRRNEDAYSNTSLLDTLMVECIISERKSPTRDANPSSVCRADAAVRRSDRQDGGNAATFADREKRVEGRPDLQTRRGAERGSRPSVLLQSGRHGPDTIRPTSALSILAPLAQTNVGPGGLSTFAAPVPEPTPDVGSRQSFRFEGVAVAGPSAHHTARAASSSGAYSLFRRFDLLVWPEWEERR